MDVSKGETKMTLEAITQPTQSPSGAVEWTLDGSHTSVTFGVRHMMVSTVRGEFQKVSGSVTFDRKNPERSSVTVDIDVASINTRDEKRDQHLRSADFFDVAKYPLITFRSKKVTPKSSEEFDVAGDLTIHGVTKEVVLKVEGLTGEHADPWGMVRMGASAKTKVKRSEFGMTWNAALEAGGILVGDEISIQLEVELQRAK
ncbi:MAG: YceI family protein [Labilithrix sp.]|nr:YceI family protein [Labilithrix sp.]MCW5816129.1 YceI family protein [Labilithrix sp.]